MRSSGMRVLQWLAGSAIVAFAARSLARNWSDLRSQPLEWRVEPGWLLLSAVVVWLMYALLVVAWRTMLAGWGQRHGRMDRGPDLDGLEPGQVPARQGLGSRRHGAHGAARRHRTVGRHGVGRRAAGARRRHRRRRRRAHGARGARGRAPRLRGHPRPARGRRGRGRRTAAVAAAAHGACSTLRRQTPRRGARRPPPVSSSASSPMPWRGSAMARALWLLARGLFPGVASRAPGWRSAVFTASYLAGFLARSLRRARRARGLFILMLQGPLGIGAATALALASRLLLTVTEFGAAVPFLVSPQGRARAHPDSSSAARVRAPSSRRRSRGRSFWLAALTLCWPMLAGQFLVAATTSTSPGTRSGCSAPRCSRRRDISPSGIRTCSAGCRTSRPMHGDIFYPTAWLRWFLPIDTAMTWASSPTSCWRASRMYALPAGAPRELDRGARRRPRLRAVGHRRLAGQPGTRRQVVRVGPRAAGAFSRCSAPCATRRPWGYGLLALTVGLCMLSPHYQMTYYLLVAAGLWTLYLVFLDPDRPAGLRWPRELALLFGAVLLGLAIAAIQVLPFLQYIPFSPRGTGGPSGGWELRRSSFSMPPEELDHHRAAAVQRRARGLLGPQLLQAAHRVSRRRGRGAGRPRAGRPQPAAHRAGARRRSRSCSCWSRSAATRRSTACGTK